MDMARKPVVSGRGANQLSKTTAEAPVPLDVSVLAIVAGLEGCDLNGLRRQWRAHLGGEPPLHLDRWVLMKVLAYRLQADVFGGPDRSIDRMVRSNREQDLPVPFDRRTPQTREGVGLKAGALLTREWNGKLERVMILEDGFAWNGQTFGSLSKIAKAMTGTNWNGHRFRERPSLRTGEGSAERAERVSYRPRLRRKLRERRGERSVSQGAPALRDLYPGLDRSGA
jgi:Protein of unknown function (DUF2924)